MTCPPCNNHCCQGRNCPNVETRKTATPSLDEAFDTAYAEYKANFFDIGLYAGKHIGKEIPHQIDPLSPTRNEVLEEVAKEFDKMPFGDTSASFAIFVRNLKR